MRIKLYSITSGTITLTYFTNVQMSVYYLFIFCNSFLLKSIGLLRLSIFLKWFFKIFFILLQLPCSDMSSLCTPSYNAPVDAADLQVWILYLLLSIPASAINFLTQRDIVSSLAVLNDFRCVMNKVDLSWPTLLFCLSR